jgi:hypothetical protein
MKERRKRKGVLNIRRRVKCMFGLEMTWDGNIPIPISGWDRPTSIWLRWDGFIPFFWLGWYSLMGCMEC